MVVEDKVTLRDVLVSARFHVGGGECDHLTMNSEYQSGWRGGLNH